MHNAQRTMNIEQCTKHKAQCTMPNAQCNAQCTMHNVLDNAKIVRLVGITPAAPLEMLQSSFDVLLKLKLV